MVGGANTYRLYEVRLRQKREGVAICDGIRVREQALTLLQQAGLHHAHCNLDTKKLLVVCGDGSGGGVMSSFQQLRGV